MKTIAVIDDDQPIADMLEELLRQERNTSHQRFSGIGIFNVRRRIQMRFGERYGLNLFSEPGRYTTAQLSLPYIVKERRE